MFLEACATITGVVLCCFRTCDDFQKLKQIPNPLKLVTKFNSFVFSVFGARFFSAGPQKHLESKDNSFLFLIRR